MKASDLVNLGEYEGDQEQAVEFQYDDDMENDEYGQGCVNSPAHVCGMSGDENKRGTDPRSQVTGWRDPGMCMGKKSGQENHVCFWICSVL